MGFLFLLSPSNSLTHSLTPFFPSSLTPSLTVCPHSCQHTQYNIHIHNTQNTTRTTHRTHTIQHTQQTQHAQHPQHTQHAQHTQHTQHAQHTHTHTTHTHNTHTHTQPTHTHNTHNTHNKHNTQHRALGRLRKSLNATKRSLWKALLDAARAKRSQSFGAAPEESLEGCVGCGACETGAALEGLNATTCSLWKFSEGSVGCGKRKRARKLRKSLRATKRSLWKALLDAARAKRSQSSGAAPEESKRH